MSREVFMMVEQLNQEALETKLAFFLYRKEEVLTYLNTQEVWEALEVLEPWNRKVRHMLEEGEMEPFVTKVESTEIRRAYERSYYWWT